MTQFTNTTPKALLSTTKLAKNFKPASTALKSTNWVGDTLTNGNNAIKSMSEAAKMTKLGKI
ncbi:hypothetical protein GNF18_10340 [Ligilactobacillus pobuzihii]|nr:hypothetical protein [Ligilactobacillus pobuzihii]